MKKIIIEDFDVDSLLANYPPIEIVNFKEKHLIHILELIYSIPASNKNIEMVNGFVPISSSVLQKTVRNYRQYIDYLLRTKVLVSDRRYIKGVKCHGYKFSKEYVGKMIMPVACSSRTKNGLARLSDSDSRKYNHLIKWLNPNLTIEFEKAKQFVMNDLCSKLADSTLLEDDEIEGTTENLAMRYGIANVSIEKIRAGNFRPSIDHNIFRFHSILTNLRSELRNFLTYNDQSLVSIDIRNSQPFFSTLLLNPLFWSDQRSPSGLLCIKDILPEYESTVFNSSSSYIDSFIMLCKTGESRADSDLHRYRKIVENGSFYDYMEGEIFARLGLTYKHRKSIKAALFQVLFTANQYFGQPEAAQKRVFKELFPTVYALFAQIKRRNKTNLPILLQRIESHIVLKVITKRIAKEKRNLPIFTIHDSIVTTVGNEEYVKSIMLDEIGNATGLIPQLSMDYWYPEKIQTGNLRTIQAENSNEKPEVKANLDLIAI